MPTNTTGDQGNATQQLKIKLPPIAGQGPNGGPVGFSGLGAIVTRSTGPKIQYRSIPPKPSHFTMSDIITSNLTPTIRGRKLKATPVSINSPSEFAQRFKARPITQPKVIDFDPQYVALETRRRGIHGFFPPVKLRGSAKKNGDSELLQEEIMHHGNGDHIWCLNDMIKMPSTSASATYSNRLQLAPTSYSEVRARSARPLSRSSRKSVSSLRLRKSPDSVRTAPPEAGIVYPNLISDSLDYDDLSHLPPPKRILPKRELPWVFRYKVKRNMNELAKIMASKPQPLVERV